MLAYRTHGTHVGHDYATDHDRTLLYCTVYPSLMRSAREENPCASLYASLVRAERHVSISVFSASYSCTKTFSVVPSNQASGFMSRKGQCSPILVITGYIVEFESRRLSADHAAAVHNGEILYDRYDRRSTEGLPARPLSELTSSLLKAVNVEE